MSSRRLFATLVCSALFFTAGCFHDTYDENGVDYSRAGEAGYARVMFFVVPAGGSEQRLSTEHHMYFDETGGVPRAGGPEWATVPEDRGQLGYRIAQVKGRATLDIVDLGRRDAEGAPTHLFKMSCIAGYGNAGIDTVFDSPNRGADGSFVRVRIVDPRKALCGVGTMR